MIVVRNYAKQECSVLMFANNRIYNTKLNIKNSLTLTHLKIKQIWKKLTKYYTNILDWYLEVL
jgi:hypothetical protein